MKKWLLLEVIVFIALLAVVLVIGLMLPGGEAKPAMSGELSVTTAPTTTAIPETTEPEPTWMTFPEDRQITATQAFVYDCQAESFVYLSGKETDKVYPASITKLFTAYVAMQFLEPSGTITAGDVLDLVGPGSSVAEIKKGDTLTVEQLVEAMLLPSGNDASYMLAAEVGWIIANDRTISASRAVQKFIDEMNGQARAKGMTGTHFTNPDGYHDSNHYTNHKDMVTIGKLALENPTIMQYAIIPTEDVMLGGEMKQWKNTNQLINPQSEYYCPYATGLKTGQTPSAGSCLLSSFDVKGQKYLIGVFGCPEIEDRFADTLQLLNEVLEKE